MYNTKLVKIVTIFLSIALLLAACSPTATPTAESSSPVSATEAAPANAEPEATEAPQSEEPVVIRFTLWGNDAHIKMLQSIADAYQKDHPNVSFKFDSIPVADYPTKVALQLAGSNKPDMGWMLESPALGWVSSGVLADLGPALKDDIEYNFADIYAPTMNLWVEGEAIYGIPFSTSPMFITYNKDLFKQAGIDTPDVLQSKGEWTWEKFAESAKAIAALGEGYYGYVHIDPLLTNPWRLIVPMMEAYGGDSWSRDGKQCLMNKAESTEAMKLLQKMLYQDKSIVPPGEKVDFTSGKVGMTMHQLSWLGSLKDVTFGWDFAPLPSGPAGYKPVIGQSAMVVFENSPHKDVAIDFLKFLTNKENSNTLSQFFPQARASVLESGSIAIANPNLNPASIDSAIVGAIKEGQVLPSHVEYAKIDLAVRAVLDKMWSPDADVAALMDSACEAMEPFLIK
jgi:multiple sugar transport system substrate-binding protein